MLKLWVLEGLFLDQAEGLSPNREAFKSQIGKVYIFQDQNSTAGKQWKGMESSAKVLRKGRA